MAITCVHRSTGSPTKTKPGSQAPRTTDPTQCSPGIDYTHYHNADDEDGDDDDDDDEDDDDDVDQYEEQQ